MYLITASKDFKHLTGKMFVTMIPEPGVKTDFGVSGHPDARGRKLKRGPQLEP